MNMISCYNTECGNAIVYTALLSLELLSTSTFFLICYTPILFPPLPHISETVIRREYLITCMELTEVIRERGRELKEEGERERGRDGEGM